MIEDITDLFTPEGIERLEKGQVLRFVKGDVLTELKITKIKDGKVFAKPVTTFRSDEIAVATRKGFWGKKKRETVKEHLEGENDTTKTI